MRSRFSLVFVATMRGGSAVFVAAKPLTGEGRFRYASEDAWKQAREVYEAAMATHGFDVVVTNMHVAVEDRDTSVMKVEQDEPEAVVKIEEEYEEEPPAPRKKRKHNEETRQTENYPNRYVEAPPGCKMLLCTLCGERRYAKQWGYHGSCTDSQCMHFRPGRWWMKKHWQKTATWIEPVW